MWLNFHEKKTQYRLTLTVSYINEFKKGTGEKKSKGKRNTDISTLKIDN